jgi:hypothetical protein
MDEVICPECGRPNLVEAEKCWYCQVPLVSKKNDPEEFSGSDAGMAGSETAGGRSEAPEENEENLPEWLKRIRELKKADTPIEQADEWQQDKLFPGLAQDVEEPDSRSGLPSHPQRGYEKANPKPAIPNDQPMLDEAPLEKDTIEKIIDEDDYSQDEEDPGVPDDELPEGFTPLEH